MALCSMCKTNNRYSSSSYCKDCHALYNSRKRPANKKNPSEYLTSIETRARNAAQIRYTEPQPCYFCEKPGEERHHPDYNKPLFIFWLCKGCHNKLHTIVRGYV